MDERQAREMLAEELEGFAKSAHSLAVRTQGFHLAPMIDAMGRAAKLLRASDTAHMGWMPIRTAPKDGTRFLAYESGIEPFSEYVCWWNTRPTAFLAEPMWERDKDCEATPTHWQPLPAAPQKEGG